MGAKQSSDGGAGEEDFVTVGFNTGTCIKCINGKYNGYIGIIQSIQGNNLSVVRFFYDNDGNQLNPPINYSTNNKWLKQCNVEESVKMNPNYLDYEVVYTQTTKTSFIF